MTVPTDALAHRADDLAVGPVADAGLLVGRQVRRAQVAGELGHVTEVATRAEHSRDGRLAGLVLLHRE